MKSKKPWDFEYGDKEGMAKWNKIVENNSAKRRASKRMGESSLAGAMSMIERDLPKGGKSAMKMAAEQAPSKAEQALVSGMKSKASSKALKRLGGAALAGGAIGIGLDMLTDSETAAAPEADNKMEEKSAAKVIKEKVQKSLPKEIKGSPMMIEKWAPSQMIKSDKSKARGFLKELKRHYVTPIHEDEDKAVYEVKRAKGSKLTTSEIGAVGDKVTRKLKSPARYEESDDE